MQPVKLPNSNKSNILRTMIKENRAALDCACPDIMSALCAFS